MIILVAILAVIFAVVTLHPVRPWDLRHWPQRRGCAVLWRQGQAHEADLVHRYRPHLGIGRGLLHTSLRQFPRRRSGRGLQVIAAVLLGGYRSSAVVARYSVIGGVLLIGVLASALRLANVTPT